VKPAPRATQSCRRLIEPSHETEHASADRSGAHSHEDEALRCAWAMQRLRRRGASRGRRSLRLCAWALGCPLALVALCACLTFARLSLGPVGLSGFNPYIQRALSSRLGGAYRVTLGGSSVAMSDRGPAFSIDGLTLASASGQPILEAPKAEVAVDPFALLFGSVRPTSVEVYDVALRLERLSNGSAAISVAGEKPIVLSGLFKSAPKAGAVGATTASGGASSSGLAWIGATLTGALDAASDPNGPLAALRRVGVSRGRLVFEDHVSNQTLVFDGLELAFDKKSDGAALRLSAEGPSGRWSMAASENGAPGAARAFDISINDLSIDEIALATGRRDLGFDLDSPISARAQVSLGADGVVSALSGSIVVGAGFFSLRDPDYEPTQLQRVAGNFRWDPATARLNVDSLALDEPNGTHFAVTGSISPPQRGQGQWAAAFSTIGRVVVGADRLGEKPIFIDKVDAALSYLASARRLSIDALTAAGPSLNLQMKAAFSSDPSGQQLTFSGSATNTGLRTALRVWPSFVAAPARSWLIDHVQRGLVRSGSMKLNFSAADIESLKNRHPPADADSHIEFSISGAAIAFLPGVPPLTDLDGTGVITGRTVSFKAAHGAFHGNGGRVVTLVDGGFSVPDSEPKPAPATIDAHLSGTLDAVADLVGRPGLKPYGGGVPIDTTLLSGQVDAQLVINTKLGKFTKPSDTTVNANAKVGDFTISKIIGKQRIDQANLSVSVSGGGLRAVGQGRLLGAVASIDLERPPGPKEPTQAAIAVVLDDSARAKLGFGVPGLAGPVAARFVSTLGQTNGQNAEVDLDLTRAKIDGLVPGYSKAAGRPAKASFQIAVAPDGIDINQFAFDGGSASARGDLRLDSAGALQSVRLSKIRLSPGDDMSGTAQESKDGMKIALTGAVLDARPFLHALSTGADDRKSTGNFDLTVKSALVTGANDQAISNLALRVVERDGLLRDFALTGRFGRQALVGTMIRDAPGEEPQVNITSADAGNLLAFTDLYKRLQGGSLSVSMAVGADSVAGRLTIRDFVVRDEPGLRRILSAGVVQQDPDSSRIDANSAHFTKLQVEFSRSAGRVVLRDGSVYGPEVGTTLNGWLDFSRNEVNLAGTFVPAYGLNNLFSQIPVFGLILGGGAHEGLFGVNYRISGPASAPVLTINPLSAIAPGFLRKVFGALDSVSAPPAQ
jgi:Protein of unknown function/AsmA-like C-terminal region